MVAGSRLCRSHEPDPPCQLQDVDPVSPCEPLLRRNSERHRREQKPIGSDLDF